MTLIMSTVWAFSLFQPFFRLFFQIEFNSFWFYTFDKFTGISFGSNLTVSIAHESNAFQWDCIPYILDGPLRIPPCIFTSIVIALHWMSQLNHVSFVAFFFCALSLSLSLSYSLYCERIIMHMRVNEMSSPRVMHGVWDCGLNWIGVYTLYCCVTDFYVLSRPLHKWNVFI